MWINLSADELALIRNGLASLGTDQAETLRDRLFDAAMEQQNPDFAALISRARDEYHEEGQIEIDDPVEGAPFVSLTDDGAYVMAWVFVEKEETDDDDQ